MDCRGALILWYVVFHLIHRVLEVCSAPEGLQVLEDSV